MESKSILTKPLTKDEAKILLSFIEDSKIINNKATNATTNKLKTEEWKSIANKFNAVITSAYRTPQQLRLKWENMKKNSRKRKTMIRMNSLKTGGGSPDYIPPDEVLDRVATLLGNTVDGLPDEFGGDTITIIDPSNSQSAPTPSPISMDIADGVGAPISMDIGDGVGDCAPSVIGDENTSTPKIIQHEAKNDHYSSTPRASGYKRIIKNKKNDDNRGLRNLAICKYYEVKSKLVEENLENIRLKNIKLKLEIEKLNKENNL